MNELNGRTCQDLKPATKSNAVCLVSYLIANHACAEPAGAQC